MTKILIVESNLYKNISDLAFTSVQKTLKLHNIDFDKISVSGIFEIPSIISMGLEAYDYDGAIALGCIVKEQFLNYDTMLKECVRGLNDIAIHYALPLGFGICSVDNIENANFVISDYANNATLSCIELIKIKHQLNFIGSEQYSKYNN